MSNLDNFTQKLFSDGVSSNLYLSEKIKYEICAECKRQFNLQQNIPQLLFCGHVCCYRCKSRPYCACCIAKTAKKLKIPNYKFLISGQQLDPSMKYYDFFVRIGQKAGKGMLNLPETTLISTILESHTGFDKFRKIAAARLAIVINSRSILYSQVKDKTLKQINAENSMLLQDNLGQRSNMINVFNHELGGITK